jgi:hypothetical protein
VSDPQVRYVGSADGTSIAFTTAGEGRALVQMPAIPLGIVEMATRFGEQG